MHFKHSTFLLLASAQIYTVCAMPITQVVDSRDTKTDSSSSTIQLDKRNQLHALSRVTEQWVQAMIAANAQKSASTTGNGAPVRNLDGTSSDKDKPQERFAPFAWKDVDSAKSSTPTPSPVAFPTVKQFMEAAEQDGVVPRNFMGAFNEIADGLMGGPGYGMGGPGYGMGGPGFGGPGFGGGYDMGMPYNDQYDPYGPYAPYGPDNYMGGVGAPFMGGWGSMFGGSFIGRFMDTFRYTPGPFVSRVLRAAATSLSTSRSISARFVGNVMATISNLFIPPVPGFFLTDNNAPSGSATTPSPSPSPRTSSTTSSPRRQSNFAGTESSLDENVSSLDGVNHPVSGAAPETPSNNMFVRSSATPGVPSTNDDATTSSGLRQRNMRPLLRD